MAIATVQAEPNSKPRALADPGDEAIAAARNSASATQFVSFAIGNDQYGVDIMAVREIKGWTAITYLPKQPDYVRGVLNLRGVMVPVIDLRCRFAEGLTEATPLHIFIVVQIGATQVGLLADRVLDIISFDASQIQPVPHIARANRADFLSGLVMVDSAMIALIDLPNLLSFSPVSENGQPAGVGGSVA